MSLAANNHPIKVELSSITIKSTVRKIYQRFLMHDAYLLFLTGCTGPGLNCLPIEWPAFAQYLDEAGVDWRAYQNSKDWATTNGLFYFKAFQDADQDSSMYKRGLVFDGDNGLSAFQKSAAEGTLPEVSWIFPPGILQEHPPRSPVDGSWYINQVVNAAIHGKNYNDTIFIINYDGES